MRNKKDIGKDEITYTGVAVIGGKKYNCQVVNGVHLIEGKTVDEFLKTLSPQELVQAAQVGEGVVNGEITSPQKAFDELHGAANN